MAFAAALTRAREQTRLSRPAVVAALADAGIRISERAFAGYERGEREPEPLKQRALLAALAQIATGQSDGGHGDAPDVSADTSAETDPAPRATLLGRQTVRVPYYGRVGAGPPRVPLEAVGHIDVPEAEYAADFAGTPRHVAGQLVASGPYGYYTVDGDSAAPVFFDGERVPVEVLAVPTDAFTQDTVCVFRWDGGQMLKRLRRLPGGVVEALALNPGIEPFRFHPGEDSEVFAVLAVARVSQKQQLYTALVGRFLRIDS